MAVQIEKLGEQVNLPSPHRAPVPSVVSPGFGVVGGRARFTGNPQEIMRMHQELAAMQKHDLGLFAALKHELELTRQKLNEIIDKVNSLL